MRIAKAATPVLLAVAWSLASCTGAGNTAGPVPESEQVVRPDMKKLYMDASAEAPQSAAQHQVILRMAEQASSGKEVLLAVRAAAGVFPPNPDPAEQTREARVRNALTEKIMEMGTLDQMIECAHQDMVAPERADAFVQRMLLLANDTHDQKVWYRLRSSAFHLKMEDLSRIAQAKLDELSEK